MVVEGVVLTRDGNPFVNKKKYLLRIKWGIDSKSNEINNQYFINHSLTAPPSSLQTAIYFLFSAPPFFSSLCPRSFCALSLSPRECPEWNTENSLGSR